MIPECMGGSDPHTRRLAGAGAMLRWLSGPYRLGVSVRNSLYDAGLVRTRSLPAAVVCVGNLTVGGSGKTPFVLFLARRLASRGKRIVLISRGYRGERRKEPLVVSDGRTLYAGAYRAGDEPVLLATRTGFPVVVGADRFAAGNLAVSRFQPDLLVLDDGFQHRGLERNLDIVLVDAAKHVAYEHLLPLGRLREPVSSLKRADILILTRWREDAACREHRRFLERTFHKPVFKAVHEPTALRRRDCVESPSLLSGKKVLGFSGLARNDYFRRTLEELGSKVVRFEGFRDHPRYRPVDIRRIQRLAEKYGAEYMVTTEKDQAAIGRYPRPDFDPWILEVEIRLIGNENEFWKYWPAPFSCKVFGPGETV